jgi:dihydroxyacid dehydratase/phosphogluconate dehydratase
MDAKTFDKSKLPSRHLTDGPSSCWNEAPPCNIALMRQAQAAMLGLAGCDKPLPGVMMSMHRLNIPAVFMYGGSILPGKLKGGDVTVVDVFEDAEKGTLDLAGGKAEVVCYADI